MDNLRFRSKAWVFVAICAVTLLLVVGPTQSYAAEDPSTGSIASSAGPKLWQENEPASYVQVLRDSGDTWRSVRLPPAHLVEEMLRERGKLPLDTSPEAVEQTVAKWYEKARKDAYIGPDPKAFKRLMERENALLASNVDGADSASRAKAADPPEDEMFPTPQKNLLGVVVEFEGTDTITRTYPSDVSDPSAGCSEQQFTWGPLHLGDDPPPGPRDNFGFFPPDVSVEDYESAMFGEGPDAPGYGVIEHPNLGQVDLTGLTLQNYLLEMSRGTYRAGGGVLDDAVSVPHSHEYYGYARYSEDSDGNCTSPTFSDANYRQYPRDVIDAVVAQYGDSVDWSQYDADGDHIIDLLVMIHAGYGFQNGGGEDRLSTSSSAFIPGFEDLPQIGGTTTPDDSSDDYFVSGFNVDPEQLDLGAIQEEFEHQFGLPDIYATDGSNSNAWWGAHSSGVWGGPLGATRPVGHNLWQDWVLGWRDPKVVNYDDPEMEVTLGRARYTPEDSEDGVIVKLPSKTIARENRAGEGIGWWSQSGDLMDNVVYREFDLSGTAGQVVFSFDAWWDIETDWDYGYLEVSTDGGDTWESLPDMDGVLTDTDPNGNNLGWGLTDSGDQQLRFDLSTYAGSTIGIRFRYRTDPAVSNPGWWVDNLSLDDDSGNLYSNDLEEDFGDWTNEGWVVVPFTEESDRFYLLEWRDDNGFDKSLNDPYYPVWSDPNEPPPEFEVDRVPATTPGMTVSYRDTGEGFDYSVFDNVGSSPSYGPKLGLLVVDAHFEAVRFDTTFDEFQDGWVGFTMYGRTKSGNAAFGLTPTNEWMARLGFDVDAGQYMEEPLEEKTWESKPPVPAFHDSFGYYPGFYYPGTGGFVYLHDSDASAVLPAKDDYSTRVTWPDSSPFPQLYGVPIGPGPGLGTGNPGDDHVQFGVHAEVTDQAEDGSWGKVKVWNSLFEVDSALDVGAGAGEPATVTHGKATETSYQISENIGGMLMNPVVVVEVPSYTKYVWGSAYGGLVPIQNSSVKTPKDAAAYLASVGYEKLAAQAESAAASAKPPVSDSVRFLVWTGSDIGTRMSSPEFGFAYQADALTGAVGESTVTYFKDWVEEFQADDAPDVMIEPVAQWFLPVVIR